MDVYTYRPGEVVLVLCGYVVEGWSSIAVSKASATYKQIRGIRGKNTRVKIADKSATIRVNVPQTSTANTVFSTIAMIDAESGGGRLEVIVNDASGSSLYSSTEAYIEGPPEAQYSASQSERNWTILCDSMDSHFVGGNEEQGLDLVSTLSRILTQ